jgi:hypothetical protein
MKRHLDVCEIDNLAHVPSQINQKNYTLTDLPSSAFSTAHQRNDNEPTHSLLLISFSRILCVNLCKLGTISFTTSSSNITHCSPSLLQHPRQLVPLPNLQQIKEPRRLLLGGRFTHCVRFFLVLGEQPDKREVRVEVTCFGNAEVGADGFLYWARGDLEAGRARPGERGRKRFVQRDRRSVEEEYGAEGWAFLHTGEGR